MSQPHPQPVPLDPKPGCLISGLIALSEVAAFPINLLVRGREATAMELEEMATKRGLGAEECRYRHYRFRQLRIEGVIVAFCMIPLLSLWIDTTFGVTSWRPVLLGLNIFIIFNTFFVSFAYVLPHSRSRFGQGSDLSRALMINMAAFCANILAFGYCYSWLNIHPPGEPRDWIDPFYFSAKSAFTVGYGDLAPQGNLAKSVAMAQSLVSFVFSLVILGRIISSIPAITPNQRNRE